MPFNLRHVSVSKKFEPVTHETPEGTYFTIAERGEFEVLYPGRFDRVANATVRHRMRLDTPSTDVPDPPGGIDQPGGHGPGHPPTQPSPLHNGVQVTVEAIEFVLMIFAPDGAQFTKPEVTLEDLKKYRDLRGTPVGTWRYTLNGRSKTYVLTDALNEAVYEPTGMIELSVYETVKSESASSLVASQRLDGLRQEFTFDLNRVGQFVAEITHSSPFDPWRGSMTLSDPDGKRIGSTTGKTLRCDIPLSALGVSRGPDGATRKWSLQVSPQGGTLIGQPRISATVVGAGRIGTSVLHSRVNSLIGPNGSFIDLVGENKDGQARARLTIKDVTAAETIDMFGFLDGMLKKAGTSTDLVANQPCTLYSRDASLDYGLSLDVSSIRLKSIGVEVGPGKGLGADVPAVRLKLAAQGSLKVKWHGLTLGTAKLRDGHAAIEVGVKLDADGCPRVVTWVSDDPFDIDLDTAVIAALILALGIAGGITAGVITEYVEHVINDQIAEGARELFDDPALAPKIFMMLFGAHLTYRGIRFEGTDIVFDHVAPAEHDPRPRRGYAGAIGRTVSLEGNDAVRFLPASLGDTWAVENLASKIQHIVVVMMENRSYDHVLGYRARAPIDDGADGLTDAVIAAVGATDEQHVVRPLREAGFAPNAIGKMTRIPKGVGHELDDVTQQLAGRIAGPADAQINDPKGFTDNFRDERLTGDALGCVPDDVLGYYDAGDLPMFAHLAEHYAYCDRYYCSHPGPTLPNRMYSLTGDVQYDRFGVPILRNNHGDNFLLSRAQSIYDVLTRKGVSWRIYESAPSVTMLRMFARYATNDTDIRPLDRFEAEVASGDLASFTVVEPAMHHHPQDDDHPDADMHRGQLFIKRVYDALRASPKWEHTLLLITYDEHGGLYDHVVPPVADVVSPPRLRPGLDHHLDHVLDAALVEDAAPDPRGDAVLGGAVGAFLEPHTVAVLEPHAETALAPRGRAALAARGGAVLGRVGTRVSEHVESAVADIRGFELATDDLLPLTPQPVPPIQVPYGVRVPTFVVSPWTMRGKGPSITLDHCSILKTVLARFAGESKPFLADRVHASQTFESFLTQSEPRLDVPASPALEPLPNTVRRTVTDAGPVGTPTAGGTRADVGAEVAPVGAGPAFEARSMLEGSPTLAADSLAAAGRPAIVRGTAHEIGEPILGTSGVTGRLDIALDAVLDGVVLTAVEAAPSAIITPPLSRKRLREGTADFHDLSGWIARLIGR